MVGTTAAWTPERRARQADRIRQTRPWRHSTGPKTSAGKKKSSQNAARFRNDPEARIAYDLTQQFLSTGFVPPALGELWLAAYLNPIGDEFWNDMLGLPGASIEGLAEEPVDLFDFEIDYLPGNGEHDDWLWC